MLYDPQKAGFYALYERLESIEAGEWAPEESTAGDMLAAASPGRASRPRRRSPSPLALWTWREPVVVERPAGASAEPNDLLRLVGQLTIPPGVAAVAYAAGVKLRRVRVSPGPPRPKLNGEKHIVILSRKRLKELREQNGSRAA